MYIITHNLNNVRAPFEKNHPIPNVNSQRIEVCSSHYNVSININFRDRRSIQSNSQIHNSIC